MDYEIIKLSTVLKFILHNRDTDFDINFSTYLILCQKIQNRLITFHQIYSHAVVMIDFKALPGFGHLNITDLGLRGLCHLLTNNNI